MTAASVSFIHRDDLSVSVLRSPALVQTLTLVSGEIVKAMALLTQHAIKDQG